MVTPQNCPLFHELITANLLLTMHHVALLKILILLRDVCLAQVRLNVIFQVPGLIFVKHHEEERKLASNVPLATVSGQHPPPADHQRTNQPTRCVLQHRRMEGEVEGWMEGWMER